MQWDVIIIGAGAAGLMAAITAARRGRRVLLLEHQAKPGRKILISGGGRCNFTNLYASPENYLSQNPHFCKSALARYTPGDFIAWIEAHGIPYHEKKLGQLFCDRSASDILEMLLSEAAQAGVKIHTGVRVHSLRKTEVFVLETAHETLLADKVILATGGLSIPKVGASDLGYRLAKFFGHRMVSPEPGLVPLIFSEAQMAFAELRGLALDTRVTLPEINFRENALFTHQGLSGPAILQISSYWKAGEVLEINFLPDLDLAHLFEAWVQEKQPAQVTSLLDAYLPRRFVRFWSEKYFPAKPAFRFDPAEKQALFQALQAWQMLPAKTAGYSKAEVTTGGLDTAQVSSKTLESRLVPGLYFVGELLDVTGWLGGYNFQWAWASGHAAGQAV
ncbi:aminoacetone oxidase family FAD-binding enzyme [bacterium (Candidatus Blackallbacteria) CG17_big_fil_post_rev_8_21_14_2_50_48_46]|uniref:Aminoacetone oxidase family FAD-binding enzyme n=1 Tax=bacterium (Candidatus Blackallbacteria) CG17_big_fil_post_rev_8_21_14_2_50_48_46 TaxID=2014261 RepID=A0A2M7G8J1_9BACT|nr:MAG: aminoacetone oxidase family FAD-binding enzyme [bacterium (Candidatus Blackallbacteria) CG18_big_fil_WC_8_21_14_2_50_49_26]PIW18427.1 MAG: aminoacetone oxidase family FAD-binding enzyme [bacterium (Candidatus Blackallbacteria) CG17_big_fil_post_rev_8_21_14_2_50_48_46]PIW46588.1 MAG: aminoacetone oxidase family FAD-binding enzyme [bacterium (Candidatus Blackallbacteria) CG13_big_fil_rev_8_21_14_2_50_49_14]